MIDLLISLAIILIVVITVIAILKYAPIPAEVRWIVNIVAIIVVAVVAIWFLMQLGGHGPPMRLR